MNRFSLRPGLAGQKLDEKNRPQKNGGFIRLPSAVWIALALLAAVSVAKAANASPAVTLTELRGESNLTPERFMHYFRDFKFKLGQLPQSPDQFLASKAGDCDDFATLAAKIMGEKHYTAELIAVFMNRETHVVCYLKEARGYLDYNRRNDTPAFQSSDGTIQDIANQVATYFRTKWNYASEFTYEGNSPKFGKIVFN